MLDSLLARGSLWPATMGEIAAHWEAQAAE
jgi:hypothetical protein